MDYLQIRKFRKNLKLNQADFGGLFGVHISTVGNWEREKVEPNSYQLSLVEAFYEASRNYRSVSTLKQVLASGGVTEAMYVLLKYSRRKRGKIL